MVGHDLARALLVVEAQRTVLRDINLLVGATDVVVTIRSSTARGVLFDFKLDGCGAHLYLGVDGFARTLHVLFRRGILDVVAVGILRGDEFPILLLRVGLRRSAQCTAVFIDVGILVLESVHQIRLSFHRKRMPIICPACSGAERKKCSGEYESVLFKVHGCWVLIGDLQR